MAYRRSALMEERLANNRDRILLAARRLVAKGGFREASVSAVAAVAGLSTGAIYRYFPSKASLFVEVLTQAVNREVALLQQIAASSDSARARLYAAVRSYASRALEGPNLAYAFIAEPVDPELEAARLPCRQAFGAVFQGILRDGITAGEFPEQNVEVASAAIVGAFTEALTGPIAPSAESNQDREKLVFAICTFCVRAVLDHSDPRDAGHAAASTTTPAAAAAFLRREQQ
jgi:AcrR family transcriptional regulator